MEDFNKVYPIATVTEVSHATKFQMPSTDLQSFLLMIGSLTASRQTLVSGLSSDLSGAWPVLVCQLCCLENSDSMI